MNNANDLMQTLYLIQSGNYLKIGITNNIPARIREYQTHNPDFNIIAVRDGTRYDELFLHRLLKKYLVNKSEWMCFSQEIITTFKNIDLPHTGEVKEQIRKEGRISNTHIVVIRKILRTKELIMVCSEWFQLMLEVFFSLIRKEILYRNGPQLLKLKGPQEQTI